MSNRQQVRDAFAEAITAQISDAQRVYPLTNDDGERITQPFDFGGESPVIVVASAGTARPHKTFRGTMPIFHLEVHVFVRATVIDSAGNTTSAAGIDDTLDDLEDALAMLVAALQTAEHWTAIDYDGRSQAEFLTVLDGTEYKRERIPLTFTARL